MILLGKLVVSLICALTLALCLTQIIEAKKKVIVTKTVKTTIDNDPNEKHSTQRRKSIHEFGEENDGFSHSELFEHHSSSSRKNRKKNGAFQHLGRKSVHEFGEEDDGFSRSELFEHHSSYSRKNSKMNGAFQHSGRKSVNEFDENEEDGFSRSELFEQHSSSSRKNIKKDRAFHHGSSKTVIEHGSNVGFDSGSADEETTSHTSHKKIVRKKSGKFGKSQGVAHGKRDHGEHEDGSNQYIIRSDVRETQISEGNNDDNYEQQGNNDDADKIHTGSRSGNKVSVREGETVTQEIVENKKANSGAGSSVAVSQTQKVEQSRVAGPCGGNCLQGELVPLYRSFNGGLGDHLFTTGIAEHQSVAGLGYLSEPDMGRIAKHQEDAGCSCLRPLTRLYNDPIKDHLLVTSDQEKSVVQSQLGYKFEGVIGYCVKELACGASLPLYRFYNGHVKDHHYTVDENEMNLLKSRPGDGYAYEGIECYVWQQGWSPKSCSSS